MRMLEPPKPIVAVKDVDFPISPSVKFPSQQKPNQNHKKYLPNRAN
jgi:hypothetical protein